MATELAPAAAVEDYRRDGFVRVPGVLAPEEAARFREAALSAAERLPARQYKGEPFTQLVNTWQADPTLAALTRHPRVAALAEGLAGAPLRLWHDQVLIKQPHRSTATELHFDAPYWPHTGAHDWITAWIALVDVPVERGCMTFLPGTQHRTGLRPPGRLIGLGLLLGNRSVHCPHLTFAPFEDAQRKSPRPGRTGAFASTSDLLAMFNVVASRSAQISTMVVVYKRTRARASAILKAPW